MKQILLSILFFNNQGKTGFAKLCEASRTIILIFIFISGVGILYSQTKSTENNKEKIVMTDKGCIYYDSVEQGTYYNYYSTQLLKKSDYLRNKDYKVVSGNYTILEHGYAEDTKGAFDAGFSRLISIKIIDLKNLNTGESYFIPNKNFRIYSRYVTGWGIDIYSEFKGIIRIEKKDENEIILSAYLDAIKENDLKSLNVLDEAEMSFQPKLNKLCSNKKLSSIIKIDNYEIERKRKEYINQITSDTLAEPVFDVLRSRKYPGGEDEMVKFIKNNTKYPDKAKKNGIKGRVFLQYKITPNGYADSIKVLRGLGYGCDEEAVRVIKTLRWVPVGNANVNDKTKWNIPIKFGEK
jgi:TonB family protein